jgi:hypothetical protein
MRRDIVTILRGVFGSAVDNFYCSSDPTKGLSKGKKTQSEVKVFRHAFKRHHFSQAI